MDRLTLKGRGRVLPRLLASFLFVCVAAAALTAELGPPLHANPFETVPKDHFAYNVIRRLTAGTGIGKGYVAERVRIGETITYFDLAIWVGEALEALRRAGGGGEEPGGRDVPRVAELVTAYNQAHPDATIDESLAKSLREVAALVVSHLEVLGYPVPGDVGAGNERRRSLEGLAQIFEDFRLRGESSLTYVGVRGTSASGDGDLRHSGELRQRYRLEVALPVSPGVNVGAQVEGGGALWPERGETLALQSGSVAIGLSQAALARVGNVTGRGVSELAVSQTDGLSGLQAGLQVGTLGSTLLVANYDAGGGESETRGSERFITAWDGSLQVSDRLTVGATLAHAVGSAAGEAAEGDSTVVRLGGTFSLSPQLTLSGEMARSAQDGGGGEAVKIGAVLHPLPEMTVGAFLLTAGSGYRPIFGGDESLISRFNLSAEVGRWILSVRRQSVVRADAATGPAGLAPLGLSGASGTGEGGGFGGMGAESQTELDLAVRLDQGKVSLGYVLESVENRRKARASVEHAVGPIGTASAGFTIVDLGEGRETSSNVGLKYDFENASVSLQYEIFTKAGEQRENVTTAEFSIKF